MWLAEGKEEGEERCGCLKVIEMERRRVAA